MEELATHFLELNGNHVGTVSRAPLQEIEQQLFLFFTVHEVVFSEMLGVEQNLRNLQVAAEPLPQSFCLAEGKRFPQLVETGYWSWLALLNSLLFVLPVRLQVEFEDIVGLHEPLDELRQELAVVLLRVYLSKHIRGEEAARLVLYLQPIALVVAYASHHLYFGANIALVLRQERHPHDCSFAYAQKLLELRLQDEFVEEGVLGHHKYDIGLHLGDNPGVFHDIGHVLVKNSQLHLVLQPELHYDSLLNQLSHSVFGCRSNAILVGSDMDCFVFKAQLNLDFGDLEHFGVVV